MNQSTVRPYEGSEDYIFVSFCRPDAAQAFSMIERLCADGYRVWFDPDADPAAADVELVAEKLNGASAVLALLSDDALNNFGIKRELNFALAKSKRLTAVYLSPSHPSLGMEMQLASASVIAKYEQESEEEFWRLLYDQKGFASCKNDLPAGDAAYDTFSADVLGGGATFLGESEAALKAQEEERIRREEEERFRREEEERIRREEEERIRREEEERIRREEEERIRREEEERIRREEEERIRKEEEERIRKEEEERLRIEEEERIRKEEEEERARKAQAAEQERLAFLAQEAEAERARKQEAQRQSQAPAAPQFVFCTFCGKKLPAKTKFCTGCGSLVTQNRQKTDMPFGSAAQAQRTAVSSAPAKPAGVSPLWQLRRMSTGEIVGIPQGNFTVGRSESDVNYVIKGNSAIGRKHAVFGCTPNGVTVTDLRSLNQTRVNGQVLLPDVTYQLAEGDIVQLANEQFLLSRVRG